MKLKKKNITLKIYFFFTLIEICRIKAVVVYTTYYLYLKKKRVVIVVRR